MQVIRHSVDTLRDALISGSPVLQAQYEKYEPGEKRLLSEAFQPNSTIFQPVVVHSPSDWILSHPELAETFQEFYKKSYRCIPSAQKKTIYVQTIGPFGESSSGTQAYIHWLKEYCQAFFFGLPVQIQGPVRISATGCAFRINEYSKNLQIHAGDVLQYLKRVKPADALCIVGATMIDLYPQDSWNFVFGTASLTEGLGIFSFARYDDNFYSPDYKGRLKIGQLSAPLNYSVFDSYYTPPITSTLLLRSCKTLTHEIGHMFGLLHCQWLGCVMQGSNHLEEADRRPLHLCAICLRKLQNALGFSIAERYKALLQWIEANEDDTECGGTCSQTQLDFTKPVKAFQDHRKWIRRCLSILGE